MGVKSGQPHSLHYHIIYTIHVFPLLLPYFVQNDLSQSKSFIKRLNVTGIYLFMENFVSLEQTIHQDTFLIDVCKLVCCQPVKRFTLSHPVLLLT